MFTQQETIEFVTQVFGDHFETNGGLNTNVVCPFCKAAKGSDYIKKKLAIRTDDHRVHCWVCGYRSHNLFHLVRYQAKKLGLGFLKTYQERFLKDLHHQGTKAFHLSLDDLADDSVEHFGGYTNKPTMPEGFQLIAEVYNKSNLDRYTKLHLQYLQQRGLLNYDDLWYWKFGIVPAENKEMRYRIVFPSFDAQGELNYYSGRSISPKAWMKYVNALSPRKNLVFNEHTIDWKDRLLLVEGPFDLAKTRLATENATCILGCKLMEGYLLFDKIIQNQTPVILALDPEEWKKQSKLAEKLDSYGIDVQFVDYPKGIEDIGSMEQKEVVTLLRDNVRSYDRLEVLSRSIDRIME